MDTQLKAWLASSNDPTGQTLALKVQGAILALSSLIIFFAAQVLHIQLGASDIVSLATELGAVAGAVGVVFGAVRHIVIWAGTVQAEQVK